MLDGGISLNDSLDSFLGQRGKPHNVGVFGSSELVDDVPLAR